jgi:hypothetical protein
LRLVGGGERVLLVHLYEDNRGPVHSAARYQSRHLFARRFGRLHSYFRRPVQRSVANHLLCDGREVSKASFPELYSYLGDTQGTPVNPDNFLLPDYLTAFAPAPTADVETAADGTVTTPPPAVPPPTDYPERTDRVWGNVDSGGRRGNIP